MSWRWLLFDYADPDLPLTLRQRIRLAMIRGAPVWRMPSYVRRGRILWGISMILVLPALWPLLSWLMGTLGPIIFAPLWWLIISVSYGFMCREEVFCRVREEGYEVCPRCGYWLRGLPEDEDRCPECGAKRQPMPETGGDGDAD